MSTRQIKVPSIDNQVVLGSYSTDENKKYCDDDRNHKFFVEPFNQPNFDLTEGLDDYRDQEPVIGIPDKSLLILHWMRDHCDELKQKGILVQRPGESHRRLNLDFVTRDCVLLTLLRAAYIPHRYDMLVTLHRGTYYIENYQPCGNPQLKSPTNQRPLDSFSTMKFMQLVTSDDGHRCDKHLPVNANEMYFEVLKASCGTEKLIYSVGVHAERKDSKERPPKNNVIIKTLKEPEPSRYKSLQWWARCYVAGIPEIVCGLRDKDPAIINEVVTYNQEDLANKYDWKPEVCLMKLRSLLDDIKEIVQDDDPRSVYHLYWDKDKYGMRNRKLIMRGKIEDDYVILPDWYLKEVLGEQ